MGPVPYLGVGYRAEFSEAFLGGRPAVSWIEAVTENFLPKNSAPTRATQTLLRLRRDYPVALHGVSLNLGSADPLSEEYLSLLCWMHREVEPFLVSDHLCWTGVGGENLFDLLPIPFTDEALQLVAEKVERVQNVLRRPLVVENITYYAEPAHGTRAEAEFLNELARRTGCRFLLDINNIYVNAVNFGRDPLEYLRALDLKHVAQIHLAGFAESKSGLLIDTHGAPVSEPVWALHDWVRARVGEVPTMIERDENIPSWAEMEKELARMKTPAKNLGKEGKLESTRVARELSL